jgi:hypothetical protein
MANRDLSGSVEIHDDLAALRDQMKSTDVLAGFLAFAAVVLAIVLTYVLLAGFNLVPFLRVPLVRWAALGLVLAAGTATFAVRVLRPLLWDPSFESLARLAEERVDGLDNAFINAVQLTRQRPASGSMVEKAIRECRSRIRRFNLGAAVDRSNFKRGAAAAGALAGCFLVLALVAPGKFGAGLSMLLNPARFVPAVGTAEIAYVRPGSVDVMRGQEVRIEAGTKEAVKTLSDASVWIAPAGGPKVRKELLALSPTEFALSLGGAQTPFEYLVEIAGTQSKWFKVAVSERPSVKDLGIRYDYPEYTGLGHKEIQHSDGAISAPFGTKVTLTVESTRQIASGHVDLGEERADLLSTGDDYRREATFVLRKDGLYRFILTDADGNRNDSSVPYAMRAVQDQPPAVSIPVPGRDVAAVTGGEVTLAIEVSDDYGVGPVQLVVSDADGGGPRVLGEWADIASKSASLPAKITLDAGAFQVGRTYSFHAVARDKNNLTGPGEGRSANYALKILDPEAAKAEAVAALEALYSRLQKVLAAQVAARESAAGIREGQANIAESIAAVRTAQASIRDETAAIAASIVAQFPGADELRRILEGLVAGEMTTAVDLSDAAAKAAAEGGAVDTPAVLGVQDRIIETLKRLLGALEGLIEDARAGRLSEGNEIPSEVKDELRKLLEDLKKLVEEQKRIIEATNNLNASPVDDYTDAQKQRINELATAEADWSNFLKEAYSDLSKLPKQDFSNPALLKDIVETYSQIEMAADALSKKAVTMAVPYEQSGLELAEALTTHLEKWLPDTPDRIKWEMEEPLTQTDAPMAELPTDLQDIVGDLMEQEEDLFDDIEDTSSSWADSLDKGAGWDAMDGPISNMSAQGVTGNALPNSSEIGGRSGEGRTGKSSGEFVGDSAVGKGGRRTPTRITPDDFVAGQVNDSSKQDAGGATGGGKESGAGERGLQGPVPDQLSEKIAALAGRQAQIISGAQKVNISLKLAGYPNGDMDAAIGAMSTTEDAIRSGRLGNAIRQRGVLVKSLRSVSSVVGQDIIIRKDNAIVLPKGLQEDIIDGAQGRAPRGYDLLLKGYYESLSTAK